MSPGEGTEAAPVGPEPGPGVDDQIEEREPPMAIAAQSAVVFFLLFVLTMGLYLPVLAHRVSRVVRPHRSPWLWAIGSVVPIANLFVAFRMAEGVAQRATRVAQTSTFGPGALLGAVIATSVLTISLQRSEDWALQLGSALLRAIPWVLLQHSINRVARREAAVAPPRRWRWARRGLVVAMLAFHALALWGSRPLWQRAAGRSLASGERVKGTTGGFSVAAPSPSWVRLEPGSFGVGNTDLELFGPTVDTTVAAFIYDESNQTLDGRVDQRRRLILNEAKGEPSIDEERHFIAGQAMTAMSLAHYTSTGGETSWWVATVGRGTRFIELVAATPRGSAAEKEAERLLRSMLVDEEAGP